MIEKQDPGQKENTRRAHGGHQGRDGGPERGHERVIGEKLDSHHRTSTARSEPRTAGKGHLLWTHAWFTPGTKRVRYYQ